MNSSVSLSQFVPAIFRKSADNNSEHKEIPTPVSSLLEKLLGGMKRFTSAKSRNCGGQVYIVGAGPGDPELLTLKAYRLIQDAEVVLYDSLVSEEMLELVPASATRQYVGKRCGQHSFKQETICNLLVEHARLGRNVVRLKGGDPCVFGRVSEECEALQKANIPFAIVPGITAATGTAAYTGMPLTDRRFGQSVRFITATLKNTEDEPDWHSMVARSSQQKHQDTLVFYMGLRKIDLICQRLIAHGMRKNMPCAVVESATTATQSILSTDISTIVQKLQNSTISGPALFVVGEVAKQPWQVDISLIQREASFTY